MRHFQTLFFTLGFLVAAPSTTKAEKGRITDTLCQNQTEATCEIEPNHWTNPFIRIGYSVWAGGSDMIFLDPKVVALNLPLGLEFSFRIPPCCLIQKSEKVRLGILAAPFGLQYQSDQTHHWYYPSKLFTHRIYGILQWNGLAFTVGSPDWDWEEDRFKISKTTIGIGVIVARLPSWSPSMNPLHTELWNLIVSALRGSDHHKLDG
jgi:hypothetical protein